jgi:hypothetical protein
MSADSLARRSSRAIADACDLTSALAGDAAAERGRHDFENLRGRRSISDRCSDAPRRLFASQAA